MVEGKKFTPVNLTENGDTVWQSVPIYRQGRYTKVNGLITIGLVTENSNKRMEAATRVSSLIMPRMESVW
eukprot:CAMPEP_0176404606 /NCGR_PEP_ID=MMETSP0126-20121128/51006_1 /TAXON_ID=141414 ORGANISM="Strombidinopsis acuminatum, Strain SPMC142" /NCGR_SAMPLE_ID=MMETSP0126 /ASSEMBLY_ACC=CAM_ASM_000229 /LENGTH=69 /DNA_ID=CAMNT_0017783511 /DNA_START=262 /DNA_END=468 /DNA_ORIENTATION=+